mgnify:CR=1 FL=1
MDNIIEKTKALINAFEDSDLIKNLDHYKMIVINNQELLEKFSNDRLKVILQYYLDENNKKRERLKKISN